MKNKIRDYGVLLFALLFGLVRVCLATEPATGTDQLQLDPYEEINYEESGVVKSPDPQDENFSTPIMHFFIGSIETDTSESVLGGEATVINLGFGVRQDFVDYDHLGFDFDVLILTREYDTTIAAPPFSTISDEMTLDTFAITAGVRGFIPEESRFRAFATIGLGLYFNKLHVTGSTFGLPGTIEDDDTEMNLFYAAGIEYISTEYSFQLQYRDMPIDGGFPSFNVPGTDIGGSMWLFGFGFLW